MKRGYGARYIYQVGADLCTVGWGGFVIIDGVIFAVAVFLPIFVGVRRCLRGPDQAPTERGSYISKFPAFH